MTKIKFLTSGTILGAAILAGCERAGNPPQSALDPTPIASDQAMQARNWEQTPAVYARTGVRTRSTMVTYNSATYRTQYSSAYTETPLFLGNVLLSPYALFQSFRHGGPLKRSEARGATVEPTYNAMPPLPPSNTVNENTPPLPSPAPAPGAQRQPEPQVITPEASNATPATQPDFPAPFPEVAPTTQPTEMNK